MARRVASPVLFIGAGRSGTNLLARLLACHRDLAVYPYEANELWHPSGFPWYSSSGATPPIWKDPYAFTRATLTRRTPAYDERLRALFGAFQTLVGGTSVVNKSVMITFMITEILEIFPDARFLHLVRDGRAVAFSFAHHERRLIDRFPDKYAKNGFDLPFEQLLDHFALYWKRHIMEIELRRRNFDPDGRHRLHELRYEELCADPSRQLGYIGQFLGVAPEGFRDIGYANVRNQNHKYAAALDSETVARLTSIMEPELSLKGYGSNRATDERGGA